LVTFKIRGATSALIYITAHACGHGLGLMASTGKDTVQVGGLATVKKAVD
jgi:hypothetical protein